MINKNYTDYGKVIPGAKKDFFIQNYNDIKDNEIGVQFAMATKSNLFPESLYEKAEDYNKYLIDLVRKSMRNKPKQRSEKAVTDYINGVIQIRNLLIDKQNDPKGLIDIIGRINWRMNNKNVFYRSIDFYKTCKFHYNNQLNKKNQPKRKRKTAIRLALKKLDKLVHTGSNYRKGKNITTKKLNDSFNFYGIQYGNWVSEKERIKVVNNAYEALNDLVVALNLKDNNITFNGSLGLAFGARGSGNSAAHYEPDYKVINLTRFNGQGSLAHEWAHALDHYIGIKLNRSDLLSKEIPRHIDRKTIPSFYKLVDRLNDYNTQYKKDSLKCDKVEGRLNKYWSSTHEMFARAFNCYVIDKLAEKGIRNDYLATEPEYYLDEYSFNPNPKGEERKELNRLFDNLFEELNELDILS